MLPKPKNSVTVGANKNRVFQRESNRSLVPHTLSKKPVENETTKRVVNPSNSIKTEKSEIESEDEDDEDISGSSFFSLETKPITERLPQASKISVEPQTSTNLKQSSTEVEKSKDTVTVEKSLPSHTVNKQQNKSQKGTKDNSFFASLFGKTSQPVQNSAKNTIEQNTAIQIDSKPDVTLPNKNKEELMTSYGVTAPYGSNSSSVTAPYEENIAGVTAPYGGNSSSVTAPYGSYGNQQQQSHGYPSQPTSSSSENFFSYSHDTNQNKQPQVSVKNLKRAGT